MKKIVCLLLLGMSYRILMSFSGVDGVDAGFCNTFYQVFFLHPDSNIFNFIYYLLGLLGALWEEYFGVYGLLGFRVLEAFTMTCAVFMLCLTFKDDMSRRQIAMAVILSMVFPMIFVTFHYNTLSFLLISIATFCFKRTLASNRSLWLLLSGMAIGISFFVRLVNGTLLVLLVLPLGYYWHKSGRSLAVRKTSEMILGVFCGFIIIIGIMLSLGQITYYLDALGEALSTFQGDEATHSHGNLIKQYFKSYVNLIMQMVAILTIYYVYLRSKSLRKNKRSLIAFTLTIAFVVLAYTSLPYLTAMALCILIIVHFFLRTTDMAHMKVTVFFLLVASLVYPFGSDIGIQGVFHWCAGLLIFPTVYCAGRLFAKENRGALLVAYFSILLCAVCRTMVSVYGEESKRFSCTTRIHSDRLNVYTTPLKATRYEKTINAINHYVGKNRLLFVTNQASELYYATNTLPYEGHVQPVIYLGDRLVWRLNERLNHFKDYPLIAMLDQEDPSAETPEVQNITMKWMVKHAYRLIYDDGYLKLYKSQLSN